MTELTTEARRNEGEDTEFFIVLSVISPPSSVPLW